MPENYPEAYNVQAQEGQAGEGYQPESGYEAGEPFEGQFDVPEFVQQVRDQLNEVREALSAQDKVLYGPPMRGGLFQRVDPIEEIRRQQARQALYREEERLMKALQDSEWLIPPMLEPPHNSSLSREKAKEILHHGEVHGKPISEAQRGLFGVIASGKKPRVKSYR